MIPKDFINVLNHIDDMMHNGLMNSKLLNEVGELVDYINKENTNLYNKVDTITTVNDDGKEETLKVK